MTAPAEPTLTLRNRPSQGVVEVVINGDGEDADYYLLYRGTAHYPTTQLGNELSPGDPGGNYLLYDTVTPGTTYWYRAKGAVDEGLFASGTTTVEADDNLVTCQNAHGMSAGQAIQFSAKTGGTGITLNRTYYVIAGGLTATKFAFSATPGGAAVDVTVDATAAAFHKISLSDYGPQAKISAAGYTAADNEPTGALLANRSRIAGGG